MKTIAEHTALVETIAQQIKEYISSNSHKKLRFFHGSTNSTREQTVSDEYYSIDISNFNDVLEVNTEEKYAAGKIFPDIWKKTHVDQQKYQEHFWSGIFTLLKESFKGKNLNS